MGLEIKKVAKRYSNKNILNEISFEVKDGSFISLLGPSGCGKTTLLNIIAGLTELDEGEILMDGITISSKYLNIPPEKRKIGMVFQDFALWPHMNVYQNVAFGLQMNGMKGKEIEKRVYETLEIFHMESYINHFPSELSGGQKQRIAMARAIAPRPKLILMDEPLSSLDAQLREEMRWELVRIFQQFKITTIYVTHDRIEAMSMSDEIVLLKDGYIEQIDSPENMYNFPKTSFAARFLDVTNEICGKVSRVNSEYIYVKSSIGIIKAFNTYNVEEGQTVTWMCRPCDLVPVENNLESSFDKSTNNVFLTKILFRSFHGGVWRYIGTLITLEIVEESKQQLRFEFSSSVKYKIDEMIHLTVPVKLCRLLQEVDVSTASQEKGA